MSGKRVAITGLGACCAAGSSAPELWQAAIHGDRRAIERNLGRMLLPVYAAKIGPHVDRHPRLRRMDRLIVLAHAAAAEAWQDARLSEAAVDPVRVAVVVGNSRGPVATMARLATRGVEKAMPTDAPAGVIASVSGMVAGATGAQGPAFVVSSSCTSAAGALATAAELINSGVVDVAVAGGSEAPLHEAVLGPLHAARALAVRHDPAEACRPFSSTRSGTVVGEGAAFLILETAEHAARRQAHIRAWMEGWAAGSESGMRAGQEKSGAPLARVMLRALARAKLSPAAIDYHNLHGTGTRLNDSVEPRAAVRVFGDRLPLSSSTKAITGHCMGASPALEAVLCVQALEQELLPPSWNAAPVDPECRLDLVLDAPRKRTIGHVMSSSSGFWGAHAALVLGRAS